jgi:hypothetical protein
MDDYDDYARDECIGTMYGESAKDLVSRVKRRVCYVAAVLLVLVGCNDQQAKTSYRSRYGISDVLTST